MDKDFLNGMTEQEKNDKANEIINKIILNCEWINIHTLHPSSN